MPYPNPLGTNCPSIYDCPGGVYHCSRPNLAGTWNVNLSAESVRSPMTSCPLANVPKAIGTCWGRCIGGAELNGVTPNVGTYGD